jgi:uncharacterized protein (TIGR03437 family)
VPTNLQGTSVKVTDKAGTERLAPLFFVSPNQINLQIPPGTAPGAATLTVTRSQGEPVSAVAQVEATRQRSSLPTLPARHCRRYCAASQA